MDEMNIDIFDEIIADSNITDDMAYELYGDKEGEGLGGFFFPGFELYFDVQNSDLTGTGGDDL